MNGRLFLTVTLALGIASICEAVDPPYLEFAAGLRDRGMPELALEYLQRLAARPAPPLGGRLHREIATTLIAMADRDDDAGRRLSRLAEARAALERALTPKPAVGESIAIRLAQIRLCVREAKEGLAVARDGEDQSERRRAVTVARSSLQEALERIPIIQSELAAASGVPREAMERWRVEVRFEEETLRMQLAVMRDESTRDEQLRRVREVQAALAEFHTLAKKHDGTPIGWSALVWVGRCQLELEDRLEARMVLEAVAKETSAPAADARRIASYLLLRMSDEEPYASAKATEIIRRCELWRNRYAANENSDEWIGVEFLLAKSMVRQAQSGVTPPSREDGPPKVNANAQARLRLAEKLLSNVAATPTEFAHRARRLRGDVLLLLTAERASKGIESLTSFEECYFTAQVELARANGSLAKNGDAINRAITALERALSLVSLGDSSRDVLDARLALAYAYLLAGEYCSAAVLGEHLARVAPSNRAARAASYALSACAAVLRESRIRGASADEIRSDQLRVRHVAELMERQWPGDPATDAARFQLGAILFEEKQLLPAFEQFSRVRDGSADAGTARFFQGVIAQQPFPADVKPNVVARAIADIERMPMPRSDGEAAACRAKLQLAHLYLIRPAPDLDRAIALARGIRELCRGEGHGGPLAAESDRALTAAIVAKARALTDRGETSAAGQLLDPIIAEVRAASRGSGDKVLGEAQRSAVVEFIRLRILKGAPEELKPLLSLLRSPAPEANSTEVRMSIVRLIQEVTSDVKASRGEPRRLMSVGLAEIAGELSGDKDLSMNDRLIAAAAFSAADRHDRAVALLSSIARPAKPDESALAAYRYARLQLAREHRLAGSLADAKIVLREVMGTPANRGWGFDNIDVRKEAVEVMLDEGNFGGAVRMCQDVQSGLLTAMRDRRSESQGNGQESARSQYFDFYFLEARALILNAKKHDDPKSHEAVRRFCIRLVKLEQNHPDLGGDDCKARFQELVATDDGFAAGYAAAHGKVLKLKSAAP